jgi:hypothetical protein
LRFAAATSEAAFAKSGAIPTTTPTMRFEFGDVVLVPFPFTSQTASKRRPAVIVSSRAYNDAKLDRCKALGQAVIG